MEKRKRIYFIILLLMSLIYGQDQSPNLCCPPSHSRSIRKVVKKVFKGCNDLHEEIDVPVVEASTYLYVYLQEVHINMTQNCSD